jgi:zinc transport system ATP-binding protein
MIKCENVNLSYDEQQVLKNVSFTIKENDYIGIVGENGSGKTTLVKAILGLVEPSSGTIVYDKQYKNKIGYVPQKNNIQKNFPATVFEVVLSGFSAKTKFLPFYSKKEKEKAISNMKCVNVHSFKDKSFQKLSGGEQQRVLLARALNSAEKIMFMDEPVANLDPIATKDFYDAVVHLHKHHNITIVTTTHDIKNIIKYANKILHIDQEILFFGTTEEYLKTEYSKYMIGSDHYANN